MVGLRSEQSAAGELGEGLVNELELPLAGLHALEGVDETSRVCNRTVSVVESFGMESVRRWVLSYAKAC